MNELTYDEAISKAEHFLAIGTDTVYLFDQEPRWDKISHVELSSAYRFSAPAGVYLVALEAGLRLLWDLPFEGRDANGKGYSLFDCNKLQEVMTHLPPNARRSFATILRDKVLPDLQKRTTELRKVLSHQWNSENCVRGLIELGNGNGWMRDD